ncbi:MAG: nucleotide pyrophosphohydrolase [Candidatus Poseidoniaceae archaeon]
MTEHDSLAHVSAMLDAFVEERDWSQFHTVKNIISSIGIEAAELTETIQWANPTVEQTKEDAGLMQKISHETADVMLYCIRLCSILGLDPVRIMNEKFQLNEEKYPADVVRGSSAKYTEYE